MRCVNHPHAEAPFLCRKHDVYLCPHCLNCQDPKGYCKFRSQCVIWELMRHGIPEGRLAVKPEETVEVSFVDSAKKVRVSPGETLLQSAKEAGVTLNASCGGEGVCGKCKIQVLEGEVEAEDSIFLSAVEKKRGIVLACKTRIKGPVKVKIPEESIRRRLNIVRSGERVGRSLIPGNLQVTPMVRDVSLKLDPPTMDDYTSDLDRLLLGLKKAGEDPEQLHMDLKCLQEFEEALKEGNWSVRVGLLDQGRWASHILYVLPDKGEVQRYGLALDVGTTSVVGYLVRLSDGKIMGIASDLNAQVACGDDVITRIICAAKEDGLERLHKYVLSTINGIIDELTSVVGILPEEIVSASVAGNTTMTHLLLKIDPSDIRRQPYIPTATTFPYLLAEEIGFNIYHHAAIFIVPGNTAYVGGDITAGVVFSGFHRDDIFTLFIDVGTNGEIVLGGSQYLMTASCSAGPAFEGGGTHWGMRAEEGAIEAVRIDRTTLKTQYRTVGSGKPRGICGSGFIDLLAEMFFCGIIDQNAKINTEISSPYIRSHGGEGVYVVVPSGESLIGEDILITQADIDTLMRSKAAIYAGFTTLLKEAGLGFPAIERFYIAGGFGRNINLENAVSIGLLPDLDVKRFDYLGNTSVAGSYLTLISETMREEARRIASGMTYIDFSSSTTFFDQYNAALFLPHTDMNAFPSVKKKLGVS